MKRKTLAFLFSLAVAIQGILPANAANSKFTNSIMPYYCGGSETASFMTVPNSKTRLALVATINDTDGIAGGYITLNNLPPATLTFSFSSQNPVAYFVQANTSAGDFNVPVSSSTGSNRYLKGKFLTNGSSGTASFDFTQVVPAGATVYAAYIIAEYYTTPATIYADNFTYGGIPLVKNTTQVDHCGTINNLD